MARNKGGSTQTKEDPAQNDREAFLNRAVETAAKYGVQSMDKLYTVDKVIPFGVFAIDWLLLGTGGFPYGRAAEVFGPESSCKSTLCYRFIGNAQKQDDRRCLILDTEQSLRDKFSLQWAEQQGLVASRTDVAHPEDMGGMFDAVTELTKTGLYSVILIDSLAMAGPGELAERNSPWGSKRMPMEEAGAITEFIKTFTPTLGAYNVALIVVNQVRVAMSARHRATETTPGGHCFHHWGALRLRLQRVRDIVDGKNDGDDDDGGFTNKPAIGAQIHAQTRKCKFAQDGKRTGVDTGGPIRLMYYKPGAFDDAPDIMWAAEQQGILRSAGAWRYWDAMDLKAQGEEKFREVLEADGNMEKLREQVLAGLRGEVGDI